MDLNLPLRLLSKLKHGLPFFNHLQFPFRTTNLQPNPQLSLRVVQPLPNCGRFSTACISVAGISTAGFVASAPAIASSASGAAAIPVAAVDGFARGGMDSHSTRRYLIAKIHQPSSLSCGSVSSSSSGTVDIATRWCPNFCYGGPKRESRGSGTDKTWMGGDRSAWRLSVSIREQDEELNMGVVVLLEEDDGYRLEERVSSLPPTLSIAPSGEPTSEAAAAPLILSVEPGPAAAVELKYSLPLFQPLISS